MADYLIKVDMGDLAAAGPIDKTVFPHLNQAVQFYVNQAHASWVESIRTAQGVWKGDKERYEDSLQSVMLSDFAGEVWTDLNLAEDIDTGRPERDLKKMLDTSLKVRVSQKGYRYLIIPFRHNIPGNAAWNQAMPGKIYLMAKKMSQSKVTGQIMRPTGQGSKGPFLSDPKTKGPMMVPGHSYQWGDRLPAGLAPKLKAFHATDPFAGMVRMAANSPKAKSSSYMTFRVMSEAPQQARKWLVAPKPGLFLAKQIAAKIEKLAEQSFQYAIEQDFKQAGLE
jgi:hypothetical protein